eukprot:scaffold182031_cov33-Tisochrysis_lutea.AAC.2
MRGGESGMGRSNEARLTSQRAAPLRARCVRKRTIEEAIVARQLLAPLRQSAVPRAWKVAALADTAAAEVEPTDDLDAESPPMFASSLLSASTKPAFSPLALCAGAGAEVDAGTAS